LPLKKTSHLENQEGRYSNNATVNQNENARSGHCEPNIH